MIRRVCTTLLAIAALAVVSMCCDRFRSESTESTEPSATAGSRRELPGPLVEIKGSAVTLDGQSAGRTDAVEPGRVRKLDELFKTLKEQRTQHMIKNPGQEFPGRVVLRAAPETPVSVFKSAFQTAAYAGYPHVSVEVKSELLPVEAMIPMPPDFGTEPKTPPKELHISLSDKEVKLTERQGNTTLFETTKPRPAGQSAAALGAELTKTVTEHYQSRQLSSAGLPDVVLHVANELPLEHLTSALGALDAARKQLGQPDKPAFLLLLSVIDRLVSQHVPPEVPASPDGGPPGRVRGGTFSVAGRMSPEEIRRVVRKSYDRFRQCYAQGLAKSPDLQGRVTVRFVIGTDGKVGKVEVDGDLPDRDVIACVTRCFNDLVFPKPPRSIITVGYPLTFTPGG